MKADENDLNDGTKLERNRLFITLKKEWVTIVTLAAIVVAIGCLFLPLMDFDESLSGGGEITHYVYLWDLFAAAPFQILFLLAVVLLASSIPLVIFGKKRNSLAAGGALGLFLAATFLILTPNIYRDTTGLEGDLYIGLAMSFSFTIIASVFATISAYKQMPMTIRDMSEDAILAAFAFALNFFKIPMGATGGSINLQMLPLFIIALRHGPLHGFISGGLVFGILTCFTDNYGWAAFPFDYLIGFGSVAVLGFFRNLILGKEQKTYNIRGELFIVVGVVLATVIRMIGGTASSMIIWEYELVPAIIYNALYIPGSGLAALIVLMALYGPLLRLNQRFPVESDR